MDNRQQLELVILRVLADAQDREVVLQGGIVYLRAMHILRSDGLPICGGDESSATLRSLNKRGEVEYVTDVGWSITEIGWQRLAAEGTNEAN